GSPVGPPIRSRSNPLRRPRERQQTERKGHSTATRRRQSFAQSRFLPTVRQRDPPFGCVIAGSGGSSDACPEGGDSRPSPHCARLTARPRISLRYELILHSPPPGLPKLHISCLLGRIKPLSAKRVAVRFRRSIRRWPLRPKRPERTIVLRS